MPMKIAGKEMIYRLLLKDRKGRNRIKCRIANENIFKFFIHIFFWKLCRDLAMVLRIIEIGYTRLI